MPTKKKHTGTHAKKATPAQAKARREFTARVKRAKVYHKNHPNGTWQDAIKAV